MYLNFLFLLIVLIYYLLLFKITSSYTCIICFNQKYIKIINNLIILNIILLGIKIVLNILINYKYFYNYSSSFNLFTDILNIYIILCYLLCSYYINLLILDKENKNKKCMNNTTLLLKYINYIFIFINIYLLVNIIIYLYNRNLLNINNLNSDNLYSDNLYSDNLYSDNLDSDNNNISRNII